MAAGSDWDDCERKKASGGVRTWYFMITRRVFDRCDDVTTLRILEYYLTRLRIIFRAKICIKPKKMEITFFQKREICFGKQKRLEEKSWLRPKAREMESVRVWERERDRACMCVCVCVCERERESKVVMWYFSKSLQMPNTAKIIQQFFCGKVKNFDLIWHCDVPPKRLLNIFFSF